jgi:hypothetical protein
MLQVETGVILRKIIADFEQLEREIDSAIAAAEAGKSQAEDIAALRRAKEAARRGAALAKDKAESD